MQHMVHFTHDPPVLHRTCTCSLCPSEVQVWQLHDSGEALGIYLLLPRRLRGDECRWLATFACSFAHKITHCDITCIERPLYANPNHTDPQQFGNSVSYGIERLVALVAPALD